MQSVARRIAELEQSVRRWQSDGRRHPYYHSEQEVCAALDRAEIEWEYVDGLVRHRLIFAHRPVDGEIASMFCPDLYLPEYDVYLEISVSGMSWLTKEVKTTQTCTLSLKRYKAGKARNKCEARVILVYGSRYQRITSANVETSRSCVLDLVRKYGWPATGRPSRLAA